jgi:diadenosine tetraphosphate (Ap4A) HIT family hydrolase
VFGHRRSALEALARDVDRLRQAIAGRPVEQSCGGAQTASCVFCSEFEGNHDSVFHELLGTELHSRTVRQTEHFLVFPPLGQFVEGGLLVATREHLLSMAHLPPEYYPELERLMEEVATVVQQHYGRRPVFFEHAPISAGVKGTCCVDHAHLNVFPVDVDIHRHLEKFPHRTIGRMSELVSFWHRGVPYLFLETGDGRRYAYEPGIVPSQYVRRIITHELGMSDRWHWRDYLGLEELKRTMATLADWGRP